LSLYICICFLLVQQILTKWTAMFLRNTVVCMINQKEASPDFYINHARRFQQSNIESVEITNKMQPCNRIYYSNVCLRLNMFRAAYRSSSEALNCICSLWFTYTCGDRSVTTCVCKPEAANTV